MPPPSRADTFSLCILDEDEGPALLAGVGRNARGETGIHKLVGGDWALYADMSFQVNVGPFFLPHYPVVYDMVCRLPGDEPTITGGIYADDAGSSDRTILGQVTPPAGAVGLAPTLDDFNGFGTSLIPGPAEGEITLLHHRSSPENAPFPYSSSGIAIWNGTAWREAPGEAELRGSSHAPGFDDVEYLDTVTEEGRSFVAAGLFERGEGPETTYDTILVRHDSAWHRLGDGLSLEFGAISWVDQIAVYEGPAGPALFAHGNEFDRSGDLPMPGIARWGKPTPCPADLAPADGPDGELNVDDVLAFLDSFSNRQMSADFASPVAVYNIDDVLEFLGHFAEGCP